MHCPQTDIARAAPQLSRSAPPRRRAQSPIHFAKVPKEKTFNQNHLPENVIQKHYEDIWSPKYVFEPALTIWGRSSNPNHTWNPEASWGFNLKGPTGAQPADRAPRRSFPNHVPITFKHFIGRQLIKFVNFIAPAFHRRNTRATWAFCTSLSHFSIWSSIVKLRFTNLWSFFRFRNGRVNDCFGI